MTRKWKDSSEYEGILGNIKKLTALLLTLKNTQTLLRSCCCCCFLCKQKTLEKKLKFSCKCPYYHCGTLYKCLFTGCFPLLNCRPIKRQSADAKPLLKDVEGWSHQQAALTSKVAKPVHHCSDSSCTEFQVQRLVHGQWL